MESGLRRTEFNFRGGSSNCVENPCPAKIEFCRSEPKPMIQLPPTGAYPLRAGDIVRLSEFGPDVRFMILPDAEDLGVR
jgi:hypothetical protein